MVLRMELSVWSVLLLFFTGLAAGVVNSVSGGGGMLSLPVLLNLGLPVPLALGTNKLQATCGTFTAAVSYVRSGAVDLRGCWLGIGMTFAGALAGALTVGRVPNDVLQKMIPVMLVIVLAYMLLRPQMGKEVRVARWPRGVFFTVFGLGLGFHDGFFGPGAGACWSFALMSLGGCDFVRASATMSVMNFTSNLAALIVFTLQGHVVVAAGATMAVGQVLGSRLGASLVMKRGARFVRPIFITMVALTILRLVYVMHIGKA